MQKPFIVGGIPMSYPVMVGTGVCKAPESVVPYCRDDLPIGAVIAGSFTEAQRNGNEGTLFYPESLQRVEELGFGLNSFGMPNCGWKEAWQYLAFKRFDTPVIASLAGFSVSEYADMARNFGRHSPGIAGIEINAGCPNAQDKKPLPMSYDIAFLRDLLDELDAIEFETPVWLKLSPLITAEALEVIKALYPRLDLSNVPTVTAEYVQEVAELIARHSYVKAVVCSNTLPNGIFVLENGSPSTGPNGGKAGVSGPVMRHISIDFVRTMRALLPETVDIIGSGGVLTGEHVLAYLQAGAKAVQCTSGPFWHGNGPRFFAEMLAKSHAYQEYLADRILACHCGDCDDCSDCAKCGGNAS